MNAMPTNTGATQDANGASGNQSAGDAPAPLHTPHKLKLATVSLAGCFGCHMSLLDIDERILPLLELVEFDSW